jgi:hypothetical protein
MEKVEEKENEDPVKVFVDQREAFNHMKSTDPENKKNLAIYVAEV